MNKWWAAANCQCCQTEIGLNQLDMAALLTTETWHFSCCAWIISPEGLRSSPLIALFLTSTLSLRRNTENLQCWKWLLCDNGIVQFNIYLSREHSLNLNPARPSQTSSPLGDENMAQPNTIILVTCWWGGFTIIIRYSSFRLRLTSLTLKDKGHSDLTYSILGGYFLLSLLELQCLKWGPQWIMARDKDRIEVQEKSSHHFWTFRCHPETI